MRTILISYELGATNDEFRTPSHERRNSFSGEPGARSRSMPISVESGPNAIATTVRSAPASYARPGIVIEHCPAIRIFAATESRALDLVTKERVRTAGRTVSVVHSV